MSIDKKHFGSLLHNEREQRGLTLKQVAEKSGLSVSYLSDIENGRTVPSIEALHNLTAAYGEQLSIGWKREGAEMYELSRAEWALVQAVRSRDLPGVIAYMGAIMVDEIKERSSVS